MKWPVIGYALLCIFGPIAWGILVVQVSCAIEQRVRRAAGSGDSQEAPPIDYHI